MILSPALVEHLAQHALTPRIPEHAQIAHATVSGDPVFRFRSSPWIKVGLLHLLVQERYEEVRQEGLFLCTVCHSTGIQSFYLKDFYERCLNCQTRMGNIEDLIESDMRPGPLDEIYHLFSDYTDYLGVYYENVELGDERE